MRSLIICLLAVSTAFAFPADEAGKTGGCPGGYPEGAEIVRGRAVYVCQGGQVVPKSCVAEDLSKVPIGGKYDNGKYRRACELKGSEISFEAVACISNGQEHKPGDTWEDGDNVYECKANAGGAEPAMIAVSKGCVVEGKRVNAKEQVPKGDVLYECRESVNGKFKLAPVGCVKDGKQLKAGDTIEIDKFWYNCSIFGRETVRFKAAGCVVTGKRLNDGDRYQENEVMYECVIDADKQYVRAMACMSGGVERKLGCSWSEGDFEYECKYDEAAKTAKKVIVRCNKREGNGVFNIDPGCYRAVDKGFAGCTKDASGSLKLDAYADEKAAQGAGLHSC